MDNVLSWQWHVPMSFGSGHVGLVYAPLAQKPIFSLNLHLTLKLYLNIQNMVCSTFESTANIPWYYYGIYIERKCVCVHFTYDVLNLSDGISFYCR